MFKSKPFYFRLRGDYAGFFSPESKGGGEKSSYAVPTKQALTGIADAIYFKPTLVNVVQECKVINPIRTHVRGSRAMVGNGKADLNYISYLVDCNYLIKYHFTWNEQRTDLVNDRNGKKHEAILERSLKKGGRRSIFLGTRECVGYVDYITEEEYNEAESHYEGETLNFGYMFNQFEYPAEPNGVLKSYFAETIMQDGVIAFKSKEACEIENTLSNYTFKYAVQQKSIDEEFDEYNHFI